ncbi:MAG: pteridine reductase [Agitococcus sp.]
MQQHITTAKTALVTGGAQRVGAAIVRQLHALGWTVIIHYRHSEQAAHELRQSLNQQRANSAFCVYANLDHIEEINNLAQQILSFTGSVNALVNNASSFYPTPIGEANVASWDDLMSSNARAPFFLSQALLPLLRQARGCIVNIIDIHAQKPFKDYPIYCMAKAALQTMTYALAKELAPAVRVNGVAPGAILWPDANSNSAISYDTQQQILAGIPLQRLGCPEDIAKTACFLINDAPYITGQIIAVDGGRSLTLGVE